MKNKETIANDSGFSISLWSPILNIKLDIYVAKWSNFRPMYHHILCRCDMFSWLFSAVFHGDHRKPKNVQLVYLVFNLWWHIIVGCIFIQSDIIHCLFSFYMAPSTLSIIQIAVDDIIDSDEKWTILNWMKLYKRRLFIAPFYMLHLPQNICFSIINLKSILETKIDRLRFTKKNPLIRNKHFNFTSYADCVRFRSHPKQISIQVTFPFYLPGPMISILRGWRREREHRIYYIYSFF